MRTKHKFIYFHEGYNNETTELDYTSSAITLTDLLSDFEYYLKGCGFTFDGHLDIVEEEDGI